MTNYSWEFLTKDLRPSRLLFIGLKWLLTMMYIEVLLLEATGARLNLSQHRDIMGKGYSTKTTQLIVFKIPLQHYKVSDTFMLKCKHNHWQYKYVHKWLIWLMIYTFIHNMIKSRNSEWLEGKAVEWGSGVQIAQQFHIHSASADSATISHTLTSADSATISHTLS